jgi:hypothetical protein
VGGGSRPGRAARLTRDRILEVSAAHVGAECRGEEPLEIRRFLYSRGQQHIRIETCPHDPVHRSRQSADDGIGDTQRLGIQEVDDIEQQ